MKLKLAKRDLTGKKVKSFRAEGKAAANIYGPNRESTNVLVNVKEFNKVFSEAGYNNLVEVEIEGGGSAHVLIKEVQSDPIREDIWHVSFYEVNMKKTITAEIPVVVEGLAPAVKTNIGILVTPISRLSVSCLPKDLPSEIRLSVSNMAEVGNSIKVEDIKLPDNVEFTSDIQPSTMVVAIAPPQKRSVETVVVEDEDAEETEGEEGEEGESDDKAETAE